MKKPEKTYSVGGDTELTSMDRWTAQDKAFMQAMVCRISYYGDMT